MNENEMEYRGSKLNTKMFEKEQRVDGSYCNKIKNFIQLRYTLMGLETGYQIKILSKQINKLQGLNLSYKKF